MKTIAYINILVLLFSSITFSFAQVGIGKVTPNTILDINVQNNAVDGITLDDTTFDANFFTDNSSESVILGNTLSSGNINLQFNAANRFEFNNNSFLPSVNATNNFVPGAIDIGRFDRHFRRVYTQAIHTNDDSVNGGLGINIGSGGGTNTDYNFTDFAFYPVVSGTRDLGRNGNFWRNFYFVNAFTPSDKTLKENIRENPNGLDKILTIKTYEYEYIDDSENKKHFGVMAQELATILPELVDGKNDKEGKLAVNYNELIPVLIKAIQEQNDKIKALEFQLLNKIQN